LHQAIVKNFTIVSESDKLMRGAEYDLAMAKFYINLQEIYKEHNTKLNKADFSTKLSRFHFKFDSDFLSSIEKGILKPHINSDELIKLFTTDKATSLIVLQGYFLRYMYEKGFEFYLSGWIWDKMLEFWEDNNKNKRTTATYFSVEIELFEKHIARFFKDMFTDNKSETIARLWGSVYIYDFFYKFHIISEEIFHDFMEISRKLKGKIIGQFTSDLWNSNFIHKWEKPDCISEIEFIEENNIFNKSISFKHQKFTQFRSELQEELSKIGELSNYIIEGGKEDSKLQKTSMLNDFFNMDEEKIREYNQHNVVYEPIRTEEKVGRNEPCPCGSGKKYKKCCGKI